MVRRTRKQSRKHSRRHRKQQGGENMISPPEMEGKVVVEKQEVVNNKVGGKRKSRKLSPWNKFVQKIYKEMKSKSKTATFSQALKEASKRKKEM